MVNENNTGIREQDRRTELQVRPRVEKGPVPILSFAVPRKGKAPIHFADLDLADRNRLMEEIEVPAFRAKQLANHYFSRFITNPDEMTDLPKDMRQILCEKCFPTLLTRIQNQYADNGKTIKTAWRIFDGAVIESVLMRYPDRTTVCVSSEAGCGMACPFCATGQIGITRNLSAAEIVEQVRIAAKMCLDGELKGGSTTLNNIVFMGMGEPMVNYKAVVSAIKRLTSPTPTGMGISPRHITVSTVGLVPLIDKLSQLGLPIRLAVSLHAPDDELRDELIPVNSKWKVGEIIDAARRYFLATGRRVSIEYALIKNMNDHQWRAKLLADEINQRGRGWAHVNPIPLNPTPGSIWTASTRKATEVFVETLREEGITTTIRDTRGQDIDGACGQLAAVVKKAKVHSEANK